MAKKRGLPIGRILVALIVIAVLAFFAYSLKQYYGENAEEGILTCDATNTNCKLSIHVHAVVHASVCGTSIHFPLETGPLDDAHTHKEPGKIHLHTTLPYDPATNKILDTSKFTLGRFFDNMDVKLTATCLDGKCNGDLCGSTPGTLTMQVNGQPNTQFRDYVWSDGDDITLTFQ
ncbi:MAG TPA: hypothetical protein VLJ21_00935 [Candidatus Binatia bacterium]|nr:hypothetical protein [Candidatus Binatia bacterium]